MQLADLLPYGVMVAMQYGAAEDDGSVSLEVFGWYGRDLQSHFLPASHYQSIEVLVVVHYIKLRDSSDYFTFEREYYVALLQRLGAMA